MLTNSMPAPALPGFQSAGYSLLMTVFGWTPINLSYLIKKRLFSDAFQCFPSYSPCLFLRHL